MDVTMFLALASSLASGLVLWLATPRGRRSGYVTFLGVSKTLWMVFHTYVSLAFAVALLVHLALNLRHFPGMVKRLVPTRRS